MILRVKYCGGCNPRYDRAAVIKRLCAAFPSLCLVGPGYTGTPDLFAVVCGCHARCARQDGAHLARYGTLVLSRDEDYDALYALVLQHIDCKETGYGLEKPL